MVSYGATGGRGEELLSRMLLGVVERIILGGSPHQSVDPPGGNYDIIARESETCEDS